MTTLAEIPLVHKQEFFLRAAEGYAEAMRAYEDASEALGNLKVTLAEAREQLKDMEADTICNGGRGNTFVLSAKSADVRTAHIRKALHDWPEYQAIAQQARETERDIARVESGRDKAANDMSLNRARMNAHTANVERQTALLTNKPTATSGRR